MGKRHVQTEWPSLIPELNSHLVSGNIANMVVSLETIKKISKKYRYMFRSDALYTEMNYMIESLSQNLLNNL
jgi:activator of HSP90 ATPase